MALPPPIKVILLASDSLDTVRRISANHLDGPAVLERLLPPAELDDP